MRISRSKDLASSGGRGCPDPKLLAAEDVRFWYLFDGALAPRWYRLVCVGSVLTSSIWR